MTRIELLSPARDLSCGIAAIDHGADAVYIGGPAFGARASAANRTSDIEKLARYAHRYHARVYLTMNTILFDHELERARELAWEAYRAGIDGLIIQDMGLLAMDLPPLMLIASTQMHNAEADHVLFLEQAGFSRVILARELSLEEIRHIRGRTSIELEVFVHGALCVGYSGRCYLSAAMGPRSANRGECGQPCRLPWSLEDGRGRVVVRDRHLLSLKDMDRSEHVEDLVHAGVSAFKIEGRLKDVAYVKNITAHYRRTLDGLIGRRPELARASSGTCTFSFEPDPEKTFHRGRTSFLLAGRDDGMASPDTPASIGEEIGRAVRTGTSWIMLDRGADRLVPGDGLCFLDRVRRLRGVQVTRIENKKVYVYGSVTDVAPGTPVHRNHDHAFLRALEGASSRRTCGVHLVFGETPEGFFLEATDEDGSSARSFLATPKIPARDPDRALCTLKRQLSKAGSTMFQVLSMNIRAKPYFIGVHAVNALRRDVLARLEKTRLETYERPKRGHPSPTKTFYPLTSLDYRFNISNSAARRFYADHGVDTMESAFEARNPGPGAVLMTSRHCIRRLLGACLRRPRGNSIPGPLHLVGPGRRFRLEFDCASCRMNVLSTQ